MNTYAIIDYIKHNKPHTEAIVYLQGKLKANKYKDFTIFGGKGFYVAKGCLKAIEKFMEEHEEKINFYDITVSCLNSKVPLADYAKYNARIEYGAIVREHVTIKDNAIIMMGAVINIGAHIGKNTMIDMNTVIGGRAFIKDNCHIGAGSVIAGVIEPASKKPVCIGNNVFIGANATVLEGITIGDNAIVGAGSVVTQDVMPGQVVMGVPARVVKEATSVDAEKVALVKDLRM